MAKIQDTNGHKSSFNKFDMSVTVYVKNWHLMAIGQQWYIQKFKICHLEDPRLCLLTDFWSNIQYQVSFNNSRMCPKSGTDIQPILDT